MSAVFPAEHITINTTAMAIVATSDLRLMEPVAMTSTVVTLRRDHRVWTNFRWDTAIVRYRFMHQHKGKQPKRGNPYRYRPR